MNRVIRRLSTLRGEYEVPIKVAGRGPQQIVEAVAAQVEGA